MLVSRFLAPVARGIWREISVAKMSQKTITSFFFSPKAGNAANKASTASATITTKSKVDDGTPIKQTKKRKIRCISDSDEDIQTEEQSSFKVEKSPVTYSKSDKSQKRKGTSKAEVNKKAKATTKTDDEDDEIKSLPKSKRGMKCTKKLESDEEEEKEDLFEKIKKTKPVKKTQTRTVGKKSKASSSDDGDVPTPKLSNGNTKTDESTEDENSEKTKSVEKENAKSLLNRTSSEEDQGKVSEETSKKPNAPGKKGKNAAKPKKAPAKTSKSTKPKAVVKTMKGKSTASKEENKTGKDEKDDASASLEKKDTPSEEVTPFNYNPAASKYHPIDDACWKRGEKVPYLALAKTLEAIENVTARLKRIEILSNLFRSVIVLTPEDLICCVYMCLNKLAPAYEGLELGIGDMVLMKAICQTTGRTLAKLRVEVKAKGDLGLVAEACRSNQKIMFKPTPLTVRGVFEKQKELALVTGNMSTAKKGDKIQSMLVACRSCESRFLIRSLGGKMRIGLAEQSVLAAIAQAVMLTPPGQDYPPEILNHSKNLSNDVYKKKLEDANMIIKTTYCECPSYDKIIDVLLKEGIEALPVKCHINPGVPMKPMLAHPTKGIDVVMQRFDSNKFTCEFKYDGERAQVHLLENGEVHVYSRNQENNTSKYPDVIARIPRALKEGIKSCILDSEAVAWDSEKKQILPFQVLSTRKKKDANEADIKVKVCIFAFDLLYLNGESLVKKSFGERRQLLRDSFKEIEGEFMFARSVDSDNAETISEFLEEAVKGNCEGLMVKTLEVNATYEISRRSHNWLKLKKDYLDGAGDTLDLVVIGGYHGKGKRTGTYGGFLLACYDEDNEEFQSICKVGTGFKDEDLEQHSKFLKEHVIESPKQYYCYDNTLAPDEWFDAVQVWEVKCADLSVSPVHKAAVGIVDDSKGISLRFPRFIRIRDDKSPESATTASQVASMYSNQEQVKNQNASGDVSGEPEEEEF